MIEEREVNGCGLLVGEKHLEVKGVFEKFLKENDVLYVEKRGLLAKTVNAGTQGISEYRLFIAKNEHSYGTFDVVLAGQSNLMQRRNTKGGYIRAPLANIKHYYSLWEGRNSLYCIVSLKEKTMLFKQLSMLISYANKATSKEGFLRTNTSMIRVIPKELEKSDDGFGHSTYLGYSNVVHKNKLIIEKSEMAEFFRENNNYPKNLKLEIKVINNILKLGV